MKSANQIEMPEEMNLASLAVRVYAIADQAAEAAARDAAARGGAISCRKGCGACCRQLVTISPAEAAALAEQIATMPEPRRSEVLARFEKAELKLRDSGMIERLARLSDPEMSQAGHYGIAHDYFRLAIPCPFLEEESCGVYEDRPAACREYLVFTPAANCSDPFANEVEIAPLPVRPAAALEGLCAQLLDTELTPIPLALAPRWIEQNPGARLRSWGAQKAHSLLTLYLDIHSTNSQSPAADSSTSERTVA